MKITIPSKSILEALSAVSGIIGAKSTLPILDNVLLSATDGKLTLTATDLDVATAVTIDCPDIASPGAVCLPMKRLMPIIREFPVADVTLETDTKNVATLRCGKSVFRLNGLPGEEFPPMPKLDAARVFTLAQKDLRDGIKKTGFAQSVDESRYALNGILFEFDAGKLTMVATDGRRLAMIELEAEPDSIGEQCRVIVPTKAAAELTKMVVELGPVTISIGESMMSFDVAGRRLVSKMIEGNFPNYRQVIPGAANERLTLNREELLTVAKRTALLASDKSNSIKLALTRDCLTITANTPDVGDAVESIDVAYKGKEFSIACNPDYFTQVLRAVPDDEIFLDLIDEISPMVVRLASSYQYILMPVRVS